MDNELISPVSRPKIHRLPEQAAENKTVYASRVVFMICLALLLVAVVPVLLAFDKKQGEKLKIKVESAPRISSDSIVAAEKSHMVPVHDEQGEIVGQLTEMPTDNKEMTMVNTVKNADSDTGKELLDIIGKY